jgi:hypothetical protein
MPPALPRYSDVNGNRTSFCDVKFGVDGVQIKGIKSISYDEDHEIPEIYGTSSDPIGRTAGKRKFTGEIEWYQAEWVYMLPILTRGGLFGFAQLAHTVTVVYATMLSPLDTVSDNLIGVRIHSPKRSVSEGAEAATVKTGLSIMGIRTFGLYEGLKSLP